jgi:beta-glucosidase
MADPYNINPKIVPAPHPGDLVFPEGFLWGTMTAPTQVEGGGPGDEGRVDNDFSQMAESDPSTVKDASTPNQGPDHWNRVEEDYSQLGGMGQNAHGFGIDWARIQPTKHGPFDDVAMQHYIDEIDICRAKGMEPNVTLLHFALPKWLDAEGGLTNPHVADYFAEFARYVAGKVGDRVTWWITINEPNVLVGEKYIERIWPGRHDGKYPSVTKFGKAYVNLLKMHARARTELRQAAPPGHTPKVSIAMNIRPSRAQQTWNPLDQAVAAGNNYFINHWFLDCIASGRVRPPFGMGQRVAGLKDSLDYFGLNYYSRDVLHASPKAINDINAAAKLDPGKPVNTYNWSVDPDGFAEAALDAHRRFPHLDIIVTENGISDNNDELRPRFLIDQLAVIHHLIELGLPIKGFFHWTDWDNWEWMEGYAQKFGLYGHDHITKKRWVKPSGRMYRVINTENRIADAWLTEQNRMSPLSRDPGAVKELVKALRAGVQLLR